jgi:hypothetical protein
MNKQKTYTDFLKSKVVIAENYGYKVDIEGLNPMLKPHNKDVVHWALDGGRRAIFLNFGLHKTFTQLVSEGKTTSAFTTLGLSAIQQIPQVLLLASTAFSFCVLEVLL